MSDGFSLSSFPWTFPANGARCLISDRAGKGFQIIADPRNRGLYPIRVNGYGANGRGNQELYVVSPQWHYVEFSKLEAVPLFTQQSVGFGNWFTNISSDPKAIVYPCAAPLNPSDLPAAMGGTYPAAIFGVTEVANAGQPIMRFDQTLVLTAGDTAAPTVITDGLAIGLASTFYFLLDGLGDTITGGTYNLWRWDTVQATWALHVQNAAFPLGKTTVAVPVDSFLIRDVADRWYVQPVGITTSGLALQIKTWQRQQ